MIFATLNSDGQFGFRDSESDSVVQTFAFDGGRIQLRYDLDGNREHRVFVDDAWTPWVTQSGLPVGGTVGQVLAKIDDGDYEVAWTDLDALDNTVVRTTRSITAGAGLTGGGDLSADRELAVDSSVVRTTRSVTAGTGLTGGGNLSANRTISIAPGGVGTSELADNAVTPAKSARLGFRTVTANTTLELGDVDSVVEVNSASARSVTVPTNASVPIPIGAVIEVVRWGVGAVTISPASGVTLHSPDDARDIASQYGSAFLRKRATDEWHLTGDLE